MEDQVAVALAIVRLDVGAARISERANVMALIRLGASGGAAVAREEPRRSRGAHEFDRHLT